MKKKHLIINCGSVKTKFIGEILDQVNLSNTIITLEQLTTNDLETADKIIISGAPILLTEVDPLPYLKKFSILKTLHKPVLGICFGHQILGLLGEGAMLRTEEARSIEYIHQHDENSPLFFNIPQDSEFEEDHCEGVTISEQFIKLASSKSCDNEAMKHKTMNWWGVQFHPEVSEKYGSQLIKNWLNLCS